MFTNLMYRPLINAIRRPLRERRLNILISQGLPTLAVPAIKSLIGMPLDRETKELVERIEQIRSTVAKGGNATTDILYSPRPGSSGSEVSISLRPMHGEVLKFSMEKIAATGKNRKWGTALHLISRSSGAKTILELGSCAGISACYLSSSPYCDTMLTVEGSSRLAEIARETTAQVNSKVIVDNALFDDVLDRLCSSESEEANFDLAFIDGHHEKVATLHYWERIKSMLKKDATVIFDDISWSHDMRDAWDILSTQRGFTNTIDLGAIGIGLWRGDDSIPVRWNLQPIVGYHHIGQPRGWTPN